MRIPKVITSKLQSDDLQIQHITLEMKEVPFLPPAFMDDDKEYIKVIKLLEKLVRQSYEYKNYVNFLKNEIDMNCCSFFNNATRDDISIEIHHSPFTLFEIACIVFAKNVAKYGSDNYDIYEVAEEITKLHYEGLIGLIPLSLTVHQLVHRGDIFIPVNCVFGNVSEFYKRYKPFITHEQKELLKNHILTTKQIDKDQYRPNILERKFTYVDIDGMSFPKPLENEANELEKTQKAI